MNFTKPNFDKNLLVLLVLAVFAAFILIARPWASESGSDGSGKPFTIQSPSTIWPGIASENLITKEVEYRPSTDPQKHDAYCVYQYTNDLYVYQFIGQSAYSDGFNLDCPNV